MKTSFRQRLAMDLLLTVKRNYHFVKTALFKALPAAVATGWPGQELSIYAITGTDGKTTSSSLLYHVLKENGYKVGLISTVGAFADDKKIDTGFHTTSPQPNVLYKLLRQFADEGIEHVVLEVTSHGLWQFRIWGLPIKFAGLTNVTREHLDYFHRWEKLVQVKSQLLTKAQQAFINQDDDSFDIVVDQLQRSKTPFTTYQQALPSDKQVAAAITKRFKADYNQWNAHLVWKMCQDIGMSASGFAQTVSSFPGVPGRMQEIKGTSFKIIVDFAHTPNAIEQVLTSLRLQTKKKLIAVYGSAGERDWKKRPAMGRAGASLADLVVFTAEDPRSEKVEVIIRHMKEGVRQQDLNKVVSIADRREAIAWALEQAKPGDTVAVLGKGHEQSMCFGTTELPWSDEKVIKKLLA